MIDKLYKKMKDYDITDPLQINLFQMGSKRQKEQGITANDTWIELVKITFEATKKYNKNNKITKWLNRNNK